MADENFIDYQEFKNLTDDQLRQQADDALKAFKQAHSASMNTALLLQAQLYMTELERRENANVSDRDFKMAKRLYKMEWWVIILIGLEFAIAGISLWYGIHEGNKQQTVLEKTLKTAKETATAMTTAKDSLKNVADDQAKSREHLEKMNNQLQSSLKATGKMATALEKQLDLAIDTRKHMTNLDSSSAATASTLSRQLDDFEAAQRAILVIQNFEVTWLDGPNQPLEVKCSILNAGMTAAIAVSVSNSGEGGNAIARGTPHRGSIEFYFPISMSSIPNPSDEGGPSLAPGHEMDCSQKREVTSADDDWVGQIRKGTMWQSFSASVSYRDIFKKAWISNDCRIYQPARHGFTRCVTKAE